MYVADIHVVKMGQCALTGSPYLQAAIPAKVGIAMTNSDHSINKNAVLALSREEAARALGVSAFTVDRLAKRGLLHPSRATRRPLYPVWDIERFLRESSQTPSSKSSGR